MLLWITLFNIHSDANVFTFYNDREKKTCIHCMCVYMYSSKHFVFSLKMNATSTWQGIFLQPYLDCKKNFFWFLSWSWTWGGGGWTLLIFWITYRSRKKHKNTNESCYFLWSDRIKKIIRNQGGINALIMLSTILWDTKFWRKKNHKYIVYI